MSVLVGNVFYAWQARRLMRRSGRDDVTALPYGINTPTMFAHIFLVMGPVYQQTQDTDLAWQTGLLACFLNGVIETAGAFVVDYLRRYTPRAALLAALAGIGLTFISMGFVFQIFASPLTALLPAIMVLALYAGRQRLPWGLPAGLAAMLVGMVLAWLLRIFGCPYSTRRRRRIPWVAPTGVGRCGSVDGFESGGGVVLSGGDCAVEFFQRAEIVAKPGECRGYWGPL